MKKFQKRKNQGITLVALVITIIILLILAGISIQAITNTGLFESESQAKKETKRAQVTEWLNLKLIEVQMNNPTGTAEEIVEATRLASDGNEELAKMGKDVVVDKNTSTIEDGEPVDVYFYVQVDEDVYKVDIKGAQFIGEEGKFPPVITLESITNTTNSITVQVTTKRNEGGTIEYYIKAEDEGEYGQPVTKAEEETTYTYTGLEQNKKYNIKIVAIAENEQTAEILVDRTLGSVPDLAEGDITFTYSVEGKEINKETWTNKEVTVTASTTVTGYTLQTSTDGKTWSNATNQKFTANGQIYAVLYDGTNYGGSATGNVTNIDTTKPVVTGATSTTNSIEITATDDASGIVGYAVTTSDSEPSSTDFTTVESTTSFSTTVTGKAQGTTYYVWVKDAAGNVSESKSTITDTVTSGTTTGAITFSTVTWSGGKASTTISTNTGYTIQYQVNSITGEWTTGTSVTDLLHGDKVYARLWDGTNAGAASAANNILDGIDPSASISLSATSVLTTSSITATVTHTDNESGVDIANCKWIYNTTASAIGTDASSYTGTFSSASQTITLSTTTAGTYYLHVLTTDVAGRTVETISNAITVNYLLSSKVSVGDYVAYDATSNYSYTPPKGSGSSSGVGGTEGDNLGSRGIIKNQMFTSNSSIRWRVLSTDTSTGEVVLISEEPIKTDDGNNLIIYGAIGYLYAEEELNKICSIYGHGTGANTSKTFSYVTGDLVEGTTTGTITGSGARSINVDDINKITGYIPSETTTYTKNIYYPTKTTLTGYSESAESRTYAKTYYNYIGSTYLTDTTSEMYKMLFRDTLNEKNIYYWLASRSESTYENSTSVDFLMRSVYSGRVSGSWLGFGLSGSFSNDASGLGVRPIVYLKSTVQTSGKDSSGAWTIIDQ